MTNEEAITRLHLDPDFIYSKRYNHSLARLLERFPDGAPDRTIAQALMLEAEDVERLYNGILEKLRAAMTE